MLEIPTFSLVYTSVRPLEIPRVVKLWNEKAVEPSKLEWVICTDEGDQLCLEAATSVAVSFNNDSKAQTQIVIVNSQHPCTL